MTTSERARRLFALDELLGPTRALLLAILLATGLVAALELAVVTSAPGWLRLLGTAGIGIICVRAVLAYRRRGLGGPAGDGLEALAVLVLIAAAGHELALPFVALVYRSLDRETRLALVGALLFVTAYLGGTLLSPVPESDRLHDSAHLVPLMLASALVTSVLAASLARHRRAQGRERTLRAAVAEFVGTQSAREVHQTAVKAALRVLGSPGEARVALLMGREGELAVVATAGEAPGPGEERELVALAGSPEARVRTEPWEPAPRRLVVPVHGRGELEGALVVDGPAGEAVDALAALADEVALARASIASRERSAGQQRGALFRANTSLVTIVDATGRVLFNSASGRTQLGYAEDEHLGRRLHDLVHPEDRPSVDALLEALRAHELGGPVEWRLRDAHGAWRWVETLASNLLEDPEVGGLVLFSRDVTDRRELVRELEEGRQRLQAVLDNAQALIMVMDVEGRCVLANRESARLLGRYREDFRGRGVRELVPPRIAEHLANRCEQALAAGVPQQFEERVHLDGERRYFDVTYVPLPGSEAAATAVCVIAFDVTARVRTQEEKESLIHQLHQSQRMESLGQMAGGVAHDFNNLLAVILNCVDFALDGLDPEHPAREDVHQVALAARRAADLTRDLLIFSRREASKRELIDVDQVILDTERLLGRTLGDTVELVARPSGTGVTVEVGQGQLEQILVNLVINARDAMEGGRGRVVMSARRGRLDAQAAGARGLEAGQYVCVEVDDDGTGMEPWMVQRAFEPFFTTKPKGHGTGLGLATVYGIVASARGHVEIASEPGQGTTFTILLPLAEARAPAPAPVPALPPLARRELILLVEDEEALRALTRRMLAKHGYDVLEAESAEDALARYGDTVSRLDLLLTDVVMPGASGEELADALRARRPDLPVLFMSGYADSAELELLQKPFNAGELLAAVRDALPHGARAASAA